ncbi:hypothetical protein [Halopseudomonas laoshanensis]|uniref:hypothetical protein n=1 Tax=Halopseudomonas laoshanensis TaxID=2268758 RepID=UPI003736E59B
MKDFTLSNVLFASAFTIALGAAAPLAVAGDHAKHDADGTHHEMDKKDHKAGHGDNATGNPGAPGSDGTGTTTAGSEAPNAPAHVPGGTNPDDAPESDRDVE